MRGLGPRLLSVDPDLIANAMEDNEADDPAWSPPAYASLLGDELGESIRNGWNDGYGVVEGVAIISISGVLIHRGAWIGRSSGQTSYEGIRAQIDAAATDPAVEGIALEIDCFGGEVAGCFDLSDRIREVAKIKPVRAFISEHAYSAAYAIAAQADQIIVPRTGGVGSIGVLCMHVDVSAAMKKEGVAVTLIHAGAHKGDANPYEALPEEVRESMQTEMEQLRQLFAETVAKGRGDRLNKAGAIATEAQCFTGAEAVKEGLADSVSDPRAAFIKFVKEVATGANAPTTRGATGAKKKGISVMAKKKGNFMSKVRAALAAEDEENIDEEEELDAMEDDDEPDAMEDDESDDDEPDAMEDDESEDDDDDEEVEPSAKSERKRINAIVNSPAAAGREKLAKHFAFSTNVSVKAAVSALKASPKASHKGTLSGLMGAEHADLKPGGGTPAKGESSKARMAKRFPKQK